MPRPSLREVRERCRVYAHQYGFPILLFNRIPMYFFQYFGSPDPLTVVSGPFDQMDIINIFMIINGISANLMTAMYAGADQQLETVLRIHEYLLRMWSLYDSQPAHELVSNFGDYFVFHLETRTLRRIDMSIVDHNHQRTRLTNFVPNQVSWRRAREIRRLYRSGQYRIMDIYDLAEFRMAWYGGLRVRQGRYDPQQ